MTRVTKLKKISKVLEEAFTIKQQVEEQKRREHQAVVDGIAQQVLNSVIPVIDGMLDEERVTQKVFQSIDIANLKRGEDGKTPTRQELLEIIRPLIPQVKDGETPTTEELKGLIKPLIPTPKEAKPPTKALLRSLIKPLIPKVKPAKDGVDGKDGSPDTGADIVSKINKLPLSGAKISAEHVEGIPAIVQGQAVQRKDLRGSSLLTQENLNSSIDKSTKTFAVGGEPVMVIKDGTPLIAGAGYTYTAPNITITGRAPQFTLFVIY